MQVCDVYQYVYNVYVCIYISQVYVRVYVLMC